MTNINCSESCVYQENGKCQLTHVSIISGITGHKCAYFQEKKPTEDDFKSK
ncbi:MAG: hypothetical protein HPY66_3096 [Firmicutes bacterium]|nr:hypothetical protein [Bacillota bacterium]MDI6707052.1 hydroxymyristoyl-ACP dehydratase [Bacillota bacterium]